MENPDSTAAAGAAPGTARMSRFVAPPIRMEGALDARVASGLRDQLRRWCSKRLGDEQQVGIRRGVAGQHTVSTREDPAAVESPSR